MHPALGLAFRSLMRAPFHTVAVSTVLGALMAIVVLFGVVGDAQVRGLTGLLAENDADLWVVASGSQGALAASRIDPDLIPSVASVTGVVAVAPIGEVRIGVRIDGGRLRDASLWGIDDDGPAAAALVAGQAVSGSMQAVADGADRGLGLEPGAMVELVDLGWTLEIVGLTEGRRFASIPTIIVPYAVWAEVIDALNPDSDDVVPTALAVQVDATADVEEVARAIAAVSPRLAAERPATLAAELPGIDGLRSSFRAAALVALVAVVAVTAAFTRLQLEHDRQTLAMLRALGAGKRFVVVLFQARMTILVVLGVGAAAVIVSGSAWLSPPQIPLALDTRTLAEVAVATWVCAVLAVAQGQRVMRRIDPADVLRAPA